MVLLSMVSLGHLLAHSLVSLVHLMECLVVLSLALLVVDLSAQ